MSDGVFERVMTELGLAPRPQQTKLVELARGAVARNEPLVCQAGTGVGKSYVLLSLALELAQVSTKPSVVVCPTNALVDQYVSKDAPAVTGAVGATFAHLKGRNQYLCSSSDGLQRASNPRQAYRDTFDQHGTAELSKIALMRPDEYGCPGSTECNGSDCGATWARLEAAKHPVVITNAHVLVWDQRVRRWTQDESGLLPRYGGLLVDECHELDPSARSCLSDSIGARSPVYQSVNGLRAWVDAHTRGMQPGDERPLPVEDPAFIRMHRAVSDELVRLQATIDQIYGYQDAGPERDRMLRDLRREVARLERFVSLTSTSGEYGERYVNLLSLDMSGSRQIARACVDASRLLGEVARSQPTTLVSGTVPPSLPIQVGLGGGQPIEDVGHPFDYSKSVLVVAGTDPKNRSALHQHKRVEMVARAIRQSGGGTLLLFTSWTELDQVTTKLRQMMDATPDGYEIPIWVQSRDDPADTSESRHQFTEHGSGVLAGVRTFFTGIDIPGPALRQVIIWRLPYPVPTLEWQAIQATHGKQIYFDAMLTTLVQGIGRLVRTPADCGRVLILDSRARGQRWAASPLTRHLAEFRTSGLPAGAAGWPAGGVRGGGG